MRMSRSTRLLSNGTLEVAGEAQDVFAVGDRGGEQVARRGLGDEAALAGANRVQRVLVGSRWR